MAYVLGHSVLLIHQLQLGEPEAFPPSHLPTLPSFQKNNLKFTYNRGYRNIRSLVIFWTAEKYELFDFDTRDTRAISRYFYCNDIPRNAALWLERRSCDHFMGKVSAIGHPTGPTQSSIPSGSVNE